MYVYSTMYSYYFVIYHDFFNLNLPRYKTIYAVFFTQFLSNIELLI